MSFVVVVIVDLLIVLIMAACAYEVYFWEKVAKEEAENRRTESDARKDSVRAKILDWMHAFSWKKKLKVVEQRRGWTMETSKEAEVDDEVIDEEMGVDLCDGGQVEPEELRQRFGRLTRTLSVVATSKRAMTLPMMLSDRTPVSRLSSFEFEKSLANSQASDGAASLYECIFVSGLYHDCTIDKLVPFIKDIYPKDYKLPNGIAELCFPDSRHWSPHTQENTRTYTLVLTDVDGSRMFGYCKRIQAEGDDVCLPLAMCILTVHNRARGLFSQILDELTTQYGRADHEMTFVYSHLKGQSFPSLGQKLEIVATAPNADQQRQISDRRPSLFRSLTKERRGSASLTTRERRNSAHNPTVKKLRRPIDFRLGGAPIASIFQNLDDILLLYSTVLSEHKLIVVSSSLSDLSLLFDAIESLLFPMSWQHTVIPALPSTHRFILDAPTPYLIGLLVRPRFLDPTPASGNQLQSSQSFPRGLVDTVPVQQAPSSLPASVESPHPELDVDEEEEWRFWESLLAGTCELDSECLVVQLSGGNRGGKVVRRPRVTTTTSGSFFPAEVVSLLRERLDLFDKIFDSMDKDLEQEERDRGIFVIVCETFLQMYKNMFGELVNYLYDADAWQTVRVDEEEALERKFDISEYMKACVPESHHRCFEALSETAMFDEYVRSRVLGGFKNVEITDEKKSRILVLRRSKARIPSSSSCTSV